MSSDNKGSITDGKNHLYLIAYFISALLYVFAVVYNLSVFRDVASCLLFLIILKVGAQHLTAIMIALSFMWHYCKHSSGISIFFVFSIACVIMYLYNQRFNITIRIQTFFIVLVILIQQLVLVFFENPYDRLFQWIGGMSYFLLILIDKNINYNHKLTIKYLACSYLAVTIGNYMAGVSVYGKDFILKVIMDGSNDYRLHFGQQLDSQGGSNYYPIISFVLAFALFNEYLKEKIVRNRIYLFMCSLFILALAFLTFTRAYVVTMFIILIIVILQIFTKNSRRIIGLVPLGGIAGIILYLSASDQINDLVVGIISRFTIDNIATVGGRYDLLLYFSEIISENISILFFGAGVKGYVYQFGNVMAHNILLDGVLCFGVFGLLSVATLIVSISRKYRTSNSSPTIFSSLGLIALMLQWLTIGSFFYEYTFYYILFVMLTLFYGFTKEINRSSPL